MSKDKDTESEDKIGECGVLSVSCLTSLVQPVRRARGSVLT